ncbi:hypothetical protein [Nocardia sp. NPDC058480]|uniref:hypothetical protein n=1 Tax=unclassified Nocardia TaxID=2637762 RepID=UPI00365D6B5D
MSRDAAHWLQLKRAFSLDTHLPRHRPDPVRPGGPAGDRGAPFVDTDPDSAPARAIGEIAATIATIVRRPLPVTPVSPAMV